MKIFLVNKMAIIDITKYEPEAEKKYFADCNVLMYEFYQNGSYQIDRVSKYGTFFSKAIANHATIYVTDLLLSEFINAYVQTEFHRLAKLNGWKQNKRYFKQTFKKTQDYKDILKEIELILQKQLFPISNRKDISFKSVNLAGIFDNSDFFDFDDRYYTRCFSGEHVFYITDDADFQHIKGIDIITANSKMLTGTA